MGLSIGPAETKDVVSAGTSGLTRDDERTVLDASDRVKPGEVDAVLETAGVTSTDTLDPTVAPEYAQAKAGTHVFMRGHQGDGVRDMQERLIAMGELDPELSKAHGADGIFGKNTEAAVRSFQEKYGLAVDGMAGQETLTKLDEVYAARKERVPEGPSIDPEERKERREEVVETAVEALGGPVVDTTAPGELKAPTLEDGTGVTVAGADAPTEVKAPSALAAPVDPDKLAHPSHVHDAMRDVITAGDLDRTEKAVVEQLGGPQGVKDRMDAVVYNAPLPNMQYAAADLETKATVTHVGGPDAAVGTPEQGAADAATLREHGAMYLFKRTQSRPNLIEDKQGINDLLAGKSPSELDAIVAADPTLGADLVRTFRMYDPEYAETLGRFFGGEEAVNEWMNYGPTPSWQQMRSGQTKQW